MQEQTNKVEIKSDTRILDGRFELCGELGKGGMGTVYLGRQLSTSKQVAIKVISAQNVDQTHLDRFKQESQLMSGLMHPNIVNLLDYGVDENGSPFLVMDFIEGESLSARLKRQPKLTEEELTAICLQIAKALAHMHERKIIHRDLKPSNIVITQDVDGQPLVKLLDLGIAKSLVETNPDDSRLTSTGDVIGSPAYMSPEQALGQTLDARSDIYSFGCLIYECITGSLPFDGQNPLEVLTKRLVEEPAPIPEGNAAPHLVPIVTKCMQRNPYHRYQQCSFIIDALQGKRSRPREEMPLPEEAPPNRKLPISMAGLVSLCAVITFIAFVYVRPVKNSFDQPKSPAAIAEELARFKKDGRYEDAIDLLKGQLRREKGATTSNTTQILEHTEKLAEFERDYGSFDDAQMHYKEALDIAANSKLPAEHAFLKAQMGVTEWGRKDYIKGLEFLREADQECQSGGLSSSLIAAQIAFFKGRCDVGLGDTNQAKAEFDKAARLLAPLLNKERGAAKILAKTREELDKLD